MARIVFTMIEERGGLRESRSAAGVWTTLGRVESSAYLRARSPGLLETLRGRKGAVELIVPFDGEGRDVHGYLAERPPELDVRERRDGEVRSVRGIVTCLAPRSAGDEVVVRDAWHSFSPAFRLTTALRFALDTGSGAPIGVAFEQSPLVVAPGGTLSLEDVLCDVDRITRSRLKERGGIAWTAVADVAEIREGDTVLALGVAAEPAEGARFDVARQTASYRDAPAPVSLVLGDVPGTRMVLARVG